MGRLDPEERTAAARLWSTNDPSASFPLPSEVEDAPGAEGWQSMYPYVTRFQPEDDERFWFHNGTFLRS